MRDGTREADCQPLGWKASATSRILTLEEMTAQSKGEGCVDVISRAKMNRRLCFQMLFWGPLVNVGSAPDGTRSTDLVPPTRHRTMRVVFPLFA